ncbi:MAG: hypothetical protein NC221_01010 [Duncaniella sp.]|nr:hypothetical protein [Duncaniella sp.]
MKFVNIIYLLIVLTLMSCDDQSVSFGKVDSYSGFLWKEANISPVKKTIEFDFSIDAQNDKSSFAEFQFVDNDGTPISTNIMQVYDGGLLLSDNKFRVSSDVKSKELTITFQPGASEGKYQGYLKLVDHNLDRFESTQLSPDEELEVLQWTLQYDKIMNPLAKSLLIIALDIFAGLLIWFLILRPTLYPRFGKITKSIIIKQNDTIVGQLNYSFKGARKVVFYNKKIDQSIWNRIFLGEIKTYVNPIFKSMLSFTPRKKNATVFGPGYTSSPNPFPKNGIASINNYSEKLSLILR